MPRDLRIDILKGIGIIAVVCGHAMGGIGLREITIFHMPLFFILAGMFYKVKVGFIQSRAKRLLLPFLNYSLLFFVLLWFTGLSDKALSKFSIYHIAAFDGPTWFLIALFLISLIYYVLDCIFKKPLLLLAVTFAIGLIFAFWDVNLPFYLRQALFSLPFFAFGRFLPPPISENTLITQDYRSNLALFLAIIGSVATEYFCISTSYVFDIYELKFSEYPIMFYIGGISVTYILLRIPYFKKNTPLNRLLASMGVKSLEIMAIHTPFLWFFKDFVYENNAFLNSLYYGRYIANLFAFILVLTLSYLLSLGVDEVKTLIRKSR